MSKAVNLSSELIRSQMTSKSEQGKGKSGSSTKKSSKSLDDYGFILETKPFEAPVIVMKDRVEFDELCTLLTGGVIESTADGLCVVVDTDQFGYLHLMLLTEKYDAQVVWHECLHMTHFIMQYVGIDIDGERSSSELQCYLQGYLVDQIKENLYPKKKKAPRRKPKKK